MKNSKQIKNQKSKIKNQSKNQKTSNLPGAAANAASNASVRHNATASVGPKISDHSTLATCIDSRTIEKVVSTYIDI